MPRRDRAELGERHPAADLDLHRRRQPGLDAARRHRAAPFRRAQSPAVAPGGNFDLSIWQLQLPVGSPGAPTTIPSSQLRGANGYTNPAYFFTDKNDGSMTFWAPEKGVTTPNSNYARSELREMNANGSAADWRSPAPTG